MGKGLASLVAAALLVAGCSTRSSESAQPDEGVGSEANWAATGDAAYESGYSRLTEIDAGNVERLGLAWSLDLPGEVTLEATPLAVDGIIYFSGSYAAVYAVEGTTGKLLW